MSGHGHLVSPGYEYILYYAYNVLPYWLQEIGDKRVQDTAKTLWLDGWHGDIPSLVAAAHKLAA